MTVWLRYHWSGGPWKTREVRQSPTRLDDIPDGVIVTFRPEGGDIKVGIGLGRERVLQVGHQGQWGKPLGQITTNSNPAV
jgi:hypothetical protein